MMGRPRLPTAVHEVKGSFIAHPERRRPSEPKAARPLGAAPKRLTEQQREAWAEIVDTAIPGVLTGADRVLVELAARLLADIWAADEVPTMKAARLEACLGRMGMTPADRSRVSVAPTEPTNDPWAALTN